MEYVNPTSIAQMFQQPKDTSFPGAGYGMLQGFLEGQAAADSRMFLDQAQAAQAQDFAKQQFEMEKSWMDRPYELEKRGVELENLRNTGQGQRLTNRGTELANEDTLLARNLKSQALLGSHYETMSQLKSPIQRKQFWDALVQKTRFGGYPRMDDLIYDGSEESWQQVLAAVQSARDSSLYQNQLAAQLEMTNRKEAGDTSRTTQTNQTSMRNTDVRAATDMAIAELRADVDRATQGGGNARNQKWSELATGWQVAEAKRQRGEPLTPEDRAMLIVAPPILAGAFTSTTQKLDRAGEVEGAKTESKIDALKRSIKKKPAVSTEGATGDYYDSPNALPPPGIPYKPPKPPVGEPLNEQDLQNRMKKYQ